MSKYLRLKLTTVYFSIQLNSHPDPGPDLCILRLVSGILLVRNSRIKNPVRASWRIQAKKTNVHFLLDFDLMG